MSGHTALQLSFSTVVGIVAKFLVNSQSKSFITYHHFLCPFLSLWRYMHVMVCVTSDNPGRFNYVLTCHGMYRVSRVQR